MTITIPSTLTSLSHALRSGELDLPAYLNVLADRFAEREPQVRAFVPENGRFERLHHAAQQLLAQYPDPAERPLLFGIPVGVKDIFHVNGFVTQAGSRLPANLWAGEAEAENEAPSVSRLRRHGALIMGKTVTTEFAYFGPGPTRNPHNLNHTPGGSSSGSAAAVAAGLCPLALGTQTIGSVNRPAAFCGVVGYKPSYGRIPKKNVLPLSPSLDHVGLFTPGVDGAEVVAGLLCGQWQLAVMMDPTSKPVLGVPEGPYLERASAEGLAHFRAVCARLQGAGLVVKSVPAMPDFEEIYARHNLIVAAEAAQVHQEWYAEYGDRYHPKTAELIERGKQVSSEQLEKARNGRSQLRRQLIQLMAREGIDLWLSPAAPGPAPAGLDSTGDPVMNLPWTHAGLPTLSLPAGKNEQGLPLGLQLTAHWYEDEKMLDWAADMEQVAGGT
jgi:Asp-tRNA(Asn)/Glu-tRNA(Gln) amidotransferase A subunit family amidase